jgi:hypothetical protein
MSASQQINQQMDEKSENRDLNSDEKQKKFPKAIAHDRDYREKSKRTSLTA